MRHSEVVLREIGQVTGRIADTGFGGAVLVDDRFRSIRMRMRARRSGGAGTPVRGCRMVIDRGDLACRDTSFE